MQPLRDKYGRFVSMKDVGKKEIEMAIRLYNEPMPERGQDAFQDARQAAELLFILVATFGIVIWIFMRLSGR